MQNSMQIIDKKAKNSLTLQTKLNFMRKSHEPRGISAVSFRGQ